MSDVRRVGRALTDDIEVARVMLYALMHTQIVEDAGHCDALANVVAWLDRTVAQRRVFEDRVKRRAEAARERRRNG